LHFLLCIGSTGDEELISRISTPSAQYDACTQHAQQLWEENNRGKKKAEGSLIASVYFLVGNGAVSKFRNNNRNRSNF